MRSPKFGLLLASTLGLSSGETALAERLAMLSVKSFPPLGRVEVSLNISLLKDFKPIFIYIIISSVLHGSVSSASSHFVIPHELVISFLLSIMPCSQWY